MYNKQYMQSLCQQYMNQHVMVQTNDHQTYHGIIEHVDNDHVYLAVPMTDTQHHGHGFMRNDERQWGFGYPYAPYPYPYPFYPSPFRRLVLPLAALTAISLLPFVW
ncbi:hypothetical protein [Alkalihalobacterium elongatum]|uniref:hypothetical protein n=1 Tax=Alkalihalobacterium elongatum TaxID=2675466 RepID=UPI001F19414E|nr:hypothetical protein [Alkalihalobacterium elongatum]